MPNPARRQIRGRVLRGTAELLLDIGRLGIQIFALAAEGLSAVVAGLSRLLQRKRQPKQLGD